jgi:GMP synthase-like glutamine amidotransferase
MKPVLIFRHAAAEGPGYLARFLDVNAIPWQLIKIDAGDAVPVSIESYSGLALMGGPMSVNDDLPWVVPVLNLIRAAIAADIPVIGHCLGGQLMSKALGAQVIQNPIKEIGWSEVSVSKNTIAQTWFGEMDSFNGFHWHGETFALPAGATHVLASEHCQNQAYALGKHLALQCHIEMTTEMIASWCEISAEELLEASSSPGVQPVEAILENLPLHCFFLNKVANQVYGQWIKGLVN